MFASLLQGVLRVRLCVPAKAIEELAKVVLQLGFVDPKLL
jgi:hypothetical protein